MYDYDVKWATKWIQCNSIRPQKYAKHIHEMPAQCHAEIL